MNIDDIQLLYAYDRWANERVLQAAATLTAEQFTRDLGGSFRSLRDTLLHIIAGEWIWLEYWKAPPVDPASLDNLRSRRESLFNPDSFPALPVVRSKWEEVEKQQMDFLNGLTDDLLAKMLPFRSTQARLSHLMQHVANHSTYHRGQVSLLMRQFGAKPVGTELPRVSRGS